MEMKRSSWSSSSSSSLSLVWLVLLLSLLSLACNVNVEGARTLKSKDKVVHPQNIYGGVGGYYFPGPGTGGVLPSPGFVGGVGFGPSGFCRIPGGCVPAGPTVLGSSLGASP